VYSGTEKPRASGIGMLDVAPTIRLRIQTSEQRYILQDVALVERLLLAHGRPIEYVPGQPESPITTIYFDTPEGTWSRHLTTTKLRARSYLDPTLWWFELKRREGTQVDKWRKPMTPGQVLSTLTAHRRWKRVASVAGESPLVPLFGVHVRRTAFEWDGLRVTIDRDLRFFAVDPESPLRLDRQVGHLDGVVIEVKCQGEMPDWLGGMLDGREAIDYSKSRYSFALREQRERPFLIPAGQPERSLLATG
jgi:hypothetical protein